MCLNLEFWNFCNFFFQWGARALKNMLIVPPGSGIVHQVNLEYLARVVFNDNGILYPDSLVGTDSHTTMINGLGVVGWGKILLVITSSVLKTTFVDFEKKRIEHCRQWFCCFNLPENFGSVLLRKLLNLPESSGSVLLRKLLNLPESFDSVLLRKLLNLPENSGSVLLGRLLNLPENSGSVLLRKVAQFTWEFWQCPLKSCAIYLSILAVSSWESCSIYLRIRAVSSWESCSIYLRILAVFS